MHRYLDKKILFFGGKGGVGKTTSASAFSLGASERGRKVLLVSTDPAHNLGDIFKLATKTGAMIEINKNLTFLEIDPHDEAHRYIDQVKGNLKSVVHAGMREEIEKQLNLARSSPGADEAALFDRIVELMLEESKNFDMIVFDTAPTGHTLRLLSLPELMELWTNSLLLKRKKVNEIHQMWLTETKEPEEDPIYQTLYRRRMRFIEARDLLYDRNKTAFIFVTIAEKLPILETKKAVQLLKDVKIPIFSILINRILPEKDDSAFIRRRKEQELIYLDEIRTSFKKEALHYVPMLDHDIYGIEHLRKVATYLYRAQ